MMSQSMKLIFSLIVICMSLLFSKAHYCVIPDDVKQGYSVCVEYVDRYTPEMVKTCVKTTVDSLASVLDALDKGAEITSAGVRRFLRDDLGVVQDTAQDVSDVMYAGTQIAISLMPGKAVSFARSLPKLEIVRLAPSGTRASTYRFAFKDMEKSSGVVKYSERIMLPYGKGQFWDGLIKDRNSAKTCGVKSQYIDGILGKIQRAKRQIGGDIRADKNGNLYKFDGGHKTGKVHLEKIEEHKGQFWGTGEVNPESGELLKTFTRRY